MEVEELSEFKIDALKETANIGTGNASMALSKLLNKTVNISIPRTAITGVKDVYKEIASAEGSVVGIYSKMSEGLEGNILVLLPQKIASYLINIIKEEDFAEKSKLEEDDIFILKKLGSVLCSAYLTGVAKFFEQKVIYKKPSIITTFGSSVIDFVMVNIKESEKVLLINISFDIKETNIKGDFLLLFTLNSLAPLLDNLEKKMGG